jgi:hypothetical protein
VSARCNRRRSSATNCSDRRRSARPPSRRARIDGGAPGDWRRDLRAILAEAPFAADLLRPDPAVSRHPHERVRVKSELSGHRSRIEQPVTALVAGRVQVRAQGLGQCTLAVVVVVLKLR